MKEKRNAKLTRDEVGEIVMMLADRLSWEEVALSFDPERKKEFDLVRSALEKLEKLLEK